MSHTPTQTICMEPVTIFIVLINGIHDLRESEFQLNSGLYLNVLHI